MNGRTRLCLQPWNTINVGADGNVYPCCVCVDDMLIGNLSESSLEEIIVGPKMVEIRNRLVSGELTGACTDCPNAGPTSVKAFHRALNLHLSTSADDAGRRDRLVMVESEGRELHSIGALRTSVNSAPKIGEELEVYSGFSPVSYLEGRVSLADNFTIGLWVKWTPSLEAGIVLHYAAYKDARWIGPLMEISVDLEGMIQVILSPDGYNQVHALRSDPLIDGQWSHLTVTKQSEIASLYLNGEQVMALPTFTDSAVNNDAIMRVGVNAAPGRGSRFSGALAGLFIDDDCLSSDDIRDTYRSELEAFK